MTTKTRLVRGAAITAYVTAIAAALALVSNDWSIVAIAAAIGAGITTVYAFDPFGWWSA